MRTILWSITKKCNLSCKYCWGVPNSFADEISKLDITKIVDRIDGFSADRIIFTGGEPLLREDIFNILKFINLKGIKTYIFTNGTLIDYKISRQIEKSGVFEVRISLDSLNMKKNEYLRGGTDKAIKGIRNLLMLDMKPRITINVVLTRINVNDIRDLILFCIDNKIDGLRFQIVALPHSHPYYKILSIDNLPKKSLECVFYNLRLIIDKYNKFIILPDKTYIDLIENYIIYNKKPSILCDAGRNFIFIDHKGDIYPCFRRTYQFLGNILQIKEKWSYNYLCNSTDELSCFSIFCLDKFCKYS